jgi:hypothetical protein
MGISIGRRPHRAKAFIVNTCSGLFAMRNGQNVSDKYDRIIPLYLCVLEKEPAQGNQDKIFP